MGGSIRSYTLMRRIIAAILLACALLALWPAAQALARPDRIFATNLPWASVAPNPPADPTNPGDPAYQWPAEVDAAACLATHAG